MSSIIEKIENSHYYKFIGVAPDGFVLIPEEVLDELKDFDFWKEWKNNPEILEKRIKEFVKKDFSE